jgi:preprotein translocase subunit SecE
MTHRTTAKRSRFSFFRETIAELKKVVWLTRREAAYLTFMVLIVAIIVGLILGGFDYAFSQLVDRFFVGG